MLRGGALHAPSIFDWSRIPIYGLAAYRFRDAGRSGHDSPRSEREGHRLEELLRQPSGFPPPEPRAAPKRVGRQHEGARDAAVGPNEGRIPSGRPGADEATLPRYCDYYSFISLAEFMTWIQKNDGSESGISYSWRRALAESQELRSLPRSGSSCTGSGLRAVLAV